MIEGTKIQKQLSDLATVHSAIGILDYKESGHEAYPDRRIHVKLHRPV